MQFPSFPLLLLGNGFHVLVIDVVLAQKAIDASIHQFYGWKDKGRERQR